MGHVLELRGLTKQFPAHTAVHDLSLEIPQGEFFALLGPSGCGKTTTLRIIAGFEAPTRGEVWLRGTRIDELRPFERNVSTVFQNYALFPHLTVRQNIEFGLRYRKSKRGIAGVVEMLQLGGKEDRLPAQLSGGERQRVALARSLVIEPEVLLLDEPLAALDPNLRKQVRTELKALQRRVGITFLFVTHDQEEALSVADRLALLNGGRLEQVGAPQEVYLRPRTRFAASFLGPVNWIDGVGVRPEATCVALAKPDGRRSMPGTVQNSIFLGNCLHIETRLTTGECVVAEVSRFNGAFQPGQPVHIWWDGKDELNLPHS